MSKYWFDIDGWFTPAEGVVLQSLVRDKSVLEFGAFKGRSTVCASQTATYIVSVDHHKGDEEAGWDDSTKEYLENIEHGHNLIIPLLCTFAEASKALPHGMFDVVLIDGAHDADSVEADTRLALQHVKLGGMFIYHDATYPSVQAGAKRVGINVTPIVDSLGYVKV